MTPKEARKLARALRAEGPDGLALRAVVRKVEGEHADGTAKDYGYQLIFLGGIHGSHGINVNISTRARALIHWRGYCEVSKCEPVVVDGEGLSPKTAERICWALGQARGVVDGGTIRAWPLLEGGCIVVRAAVRSHPSRADLEPAEKEWVWRTVWFPGMTEAEIVDTIEAAFAGLGCRTVRKGVHGSYTAATHYNVVVLEVTPRRALIRGKYRYGDRFERWVQKCEVTPNSLPMQKTRQESDG